MYSSWLRMWQNRLIVLPKEIQWFIQRGLRGWSDSDCWSIDWYLNRIMPEMLEQLAKRKFGAPFNIGQPRWKKMLLKQAILYRNMQDAYNCSDFKRAQQYLNKILAFQKKWYFALWD